MSTMVEGVDQAKILKMCLFHDLAEARMSDLNYVHQKYAEADEEKALKDLIKTLPFGDDMYETLKEMQARKTDEAKLAKDADRLEWILSLKEMVDTGNTRVETWIPSSMKRLETAVAKNLGEEIIKTNSDDWWFANKDDEWWVSRNKKVTRKRF